MSAGPGSFQRLLGGPFLASSAFDAPRAPWLVATSLQPLPYLHGAISQISVCLFLTRALVIGSRDPGRSPLKSLNLIISAETSFPKKRSHSLVLGIPSSCLQKGLSGSRQTAPPQPTRNMQHAAAYLQPAWVFVSGSRKHAVEKQGLYFQFAGLTAARTPEGTFAPSAPPSKVPIPTQPGIGGEVQILWWEARIQVPGMSLRHRVALGKPQFLHLKNGDDNIATLIIISPALSGPGGVNENLNLQEF